MGAPETAAEWTKPGGIEFDPKKPFRHLAKVDGGYPIVMMDALMYLLSARSNPRSVATMVTHGDGQVVDAVYVPWE